MRNMDRGGKAEIRTTKGITERRRLSLDVNSETPEMVKADAEDRLREREHAMRPYVIGTKLYLPFSLIAAILGVPLHTVPGIIDKCLFVFLRKTGPSAYQLVSKEDAFGEGTEEAEEYEIDHKERRGMVKSIAIALPPDSAMVKSGPVYPTRLQIKKKGFDYELFW